MVEQNDTALLQSVRKNLEGLYLQLELVQAGLIVASRFLHYQNADYDLDVARVLEYGVGDRLNVQLECIEEMIESLPAETQQSQPNEEDAKESTSLQ